MTHGRTRPYSRIARTVAVLALLATTAAPASAQTDLGSLMRQKLERAQQLFEAVVLARMPAVERHAAELLRISEASSWMTTPSTEYLRHAGEFQEAARDLAAAASEGDMDQVSTAYMTMVASCVQCHRDVRGSRLASARREPAGGPPRPAAASRTDVLRPRREGDWPSVVHTAPRPATIGGTARVSRRPRPHRPAAGSRARLRPRSTRRDGRAATPDVHASQRFSRTRRRSSVGRAADS